MEIDKRLSFVDSLVFVINHTVVIFAPTTNILPNSAQLPLYHADNPFLLSYFL